MEIVQSQRSTGRTGWGCPLAEAWACLLSVTFSMARPFLVGKELLGKLARQPPCSCNGHAMHVSKRPAPNRVTIAMQDQPTSRSDESFRGPGCNPGKHRASLGCAGASKSASGALGDPAP
ncbi:hypothetical protein B0J18DRAFT_422670 [Chaetomium sp. MPI-SDFR-AT-0129]|nr:hypothetical protein B0J18DRAFT_422670 [Chaetomium sp. MPI-SDFR-AT-0129]